MRSRLGQNGCSAGVLLFLSALYGGCAMLPENAAVSEVKPISDYASGKSLAPAADAAWPADAWWQAYGDPQLATLIDEGLAGASDMRIAAARVALAYAGVGASRASLLPTVGASAKADSERQSYNYLIGEDFVPKGWNDAGTGTLSLDWEIDFWGKNRAALAAAKGKAAAAEAEAAATRLALSTGIADVYGRLAALYADRDSAVSAINVRKQTLSLMSDRTGKGLENEGALERSRAAEAGAEAELARIDEEIGLARNQLAALIGAGPDRGLAVSRPKVRGGRYTGVPKSLPIEFLGRRPDILAARYTAEASAKEIDAARAAYYPNVNLAAMIGKQALGLNMLTDTGSTFGSVGPAVSLPIFDGGRLRAGERSAVSQYEIAVASYDRTLTEALRQVADAVVSKRQLASQLANTRRSAAAAEKAWRVVSDRYNGGLATYLEVLTAEDALITARRATAALQARAFTLDIAMVRALGGGFRSTEKQS
ncbi:efflux transporter outer membrane subunit [uncultured Pleomorphomonas sp.]|nr:efflux transporter outer membrane subunit [uncultured Pleomorphomonas sp.]